MAAKIRVTWPDGPVCGICFTTALRTRGSCPGCGKDRLLPGRTTDGTDICRDCASITTNMTCEGCGTETERFRAGHCMRCVPRTDLDQLLHPNSPPDLRLKRLIGVLAESERPESIYTWMRGAKAKELLTRLGTRDIALSHEAFDALPGSRSVEYLRELLIHHGMLPDRDRQLAAFEQ
ncbi:UNVERIFIED_ORG: RNA polymerase subunit RPABC4/transcription elongation factor Spt4 [Arthrobacter sp. UYCu721]